MKMNLPKDFLLIKKKVKKRINSNLIYKISYKKYKHNNFQQKMQN